MGIRIRFRGTDLTEGQVVDYPDADSYTVLDDDTVVLCQTHRSVGAVHRDRWETVEVLEDGMTLGDPAAADRR